MPFSIVSLASGATRITLEGDLDVVTISRLQPELRAVARRRPIAVEIDLSRVRSVNTRGVQSLGSLFAVLARIDCRITVVEVRHLALSPGDPLWAGAILDATRLAN